MDRIAAAKVSALAVAAPLSDDTPTNGSARPRPAGSEAKVPAEQRKAPNQKLELLIALLSIGAVRQSIPIMTQFPWMVAAYPDVADLYLRILRVSLQPLYENLYRPNSDFVQSNTTPRSRYGTNGVILTPARKTAITLLAPAPPDTATTEFVFFYPNWRNTIPICTVLSDIPDILMPLLKFIGVQISRDIGFITKLCRLGKIQLTASVCPFPEKCNILSLNLSFRMCPAKQRHFG